MSHYSSPTDGGSSAANWYGLYRSAMLEVDDRKILQRILDARRAICDRAEEILTGSPSDERRALNDAMYALSVLEKVAAKQEEKSPFDASTHASTTDGRYAPVPVCPVCARPVQLESSNTDEDGSAIHEECYVGRVVAKKKFQPLQKGA